mgnify:FL=1
MRKQFSILFLVCMAVASYAQENPKRVLFVGNSYTQVNNLPAMIKQLGESTSDAIECEQATSGGATFSQHCSSTGAMDRIREGGWDIVVLQGQSQEPAFPWAQFMSQTYPYACQLAEAAYENCDCAEVLFYMTWGHKNGDEANASAFDSLATYEGMDDLLSARYTYMARQNRASASPVGRVWRRLREEQPELELYQSDGSHPSLAGSYAAACTFYTLIFRKDPTLIATDLTLDAASAQTIRETVRRVVYDSIARYSCHTFLSSEAIGDGQSWRFNCLSAAEPETIEWDFGDGTTSTEATAVHTFPTGTYTVRLTAGRLCSPDTTWTTVEVAGQGGTESISTAIETGFAIYPNPASTHVVVRCAAPAEITIIDQKGRVVRRQHIDGTATVDIRDLAPGVYVVRKDNQATAKLTKL